METIKLSKRLKEAANYTIHGQPIADIGSDHAYLPIYIIRSGMTQRAIAGEVVEGPYKNAVETVKEHDLVEAIDVRLGDGLHVLKLKEDIGTIFICGMGGLLISEILAEGLTNSRLPMNARLVLQPNNNEKALREFLANQSYKIIEENIVEDKGKLYEIIVAEYTDVGFSYTEDELTFGPKLMRSQNNTFQKKWLTELANSKAILNNLKDTQNYEKIELFKKTINQIEKVIL